MGVHCACTHHHWLAVILSILCYPWRFYTFFCVFLRWSHKSQIKRYLTQNFPFLYTFFRQPVPLPQGFSFIFVLCINSASGSTSEWVYLREMIGGRAALRDGRSPSNRLDVWNTLAATILIVPWCSWRSHAAFDTLIFFQYLVWHLGCDLFLSTFPQMNLFHPVIIFPCLPDLLESH